MKYYLISGVALSGNKGASGMAEALIQNLSVREPEAFFRIFSYYPRTDRAQLRYPNAEIIDGSPKRVVLLFFLSCWAFLAQFLHLPKRCCVVGPLKKIAETDCWLDASGISFVDGREKFLIYNILSVFPALALNCPIVKVAQAMGPFHNPLNRICAKLFLPRFRLIVARGAVTRNYLDSLNLNNTMNFSDAAFSLHCTEADRQTADRLLPDCDGITIGISPSQVVWKLCKKQNIPYLEILNASVRFWLDAGYRCVVFPHSARTGSRKTHNNDLPLLCSFVSMLPEHPSLIVIKQELSAGELRALIAKLDLLTASRFHAVISAMATGVPALVIGWSHKYAEVLAQFGLEQFVIRYSGLSRETVLENAGEILRNREKLHTEILRNTAQIIHKNEDFFHLVTGIRR